jgi:HEAT repeat protein
VPSGKYEVLASVDLSPLFGEVNGKAEVEVSVPGKEILDQRLRQLKSEDANVRRTALIDLRYFKRDADVVAPALVERLDDPDLMIRRIAVSVLMSYPEHAAKHCDKVLPMLHHEDQSMRYMAAQLLGRCAPKSDAVEKALEKALEEAPENYARIFESSLTNYLNRTRTQK